MDAPFLKWSAKTEGMFSQREARPETSLRTVVRADPGKKGRLSQLQQGQTGHVGQMLLSFVSINSTLCHIERDKGVSPTHEAKIHPLFNLALFFFLIFY